MLHSKIDSVSVHIANRDLNYSMFYMYVMLC